jgi:acetoacetyl-CoA synthetase
VKDNPTEMTIGMLNVIWQRLLQRSPIGVEENFFDLGGDPSLVRELCSEIAGVCNRELAPAAICRAPTIASLTALLEQPTQSLPSPLVLLKAGREEPPVFVAPGLDGSVLSLVPLARSITTQRPIYGIHPKGLDGVDEPLERFEDMAQFYIAAIRELQPHGPYALIGYSTGGLVALEIARGLSDSGEKIVLLALLDAYPRMRYLPFGQRMRLIGRRISWHLSEMSGLPVHDALSYFVERVHRRIGGVAGAALQGPLTSPSLSERALQVRRKTYLALERYRPRFYGGKVKFVSGSRNLSLPDDPLPIWGTLTAELEIESVAGDHLSMMLTHFEKVASILSRFLTEG